MRIGFSPSGKDNDIFPAYTKHMQELEDAVELILANYRAGNTSFTLNFDDDISIQRIVLLYSFLYLLHYKSLPAI